VDEFLYNLRAAGSRGNDKSSGKEGREFHCALAPARVCPWRDSNKSYARNLRA
jgi:hypothetical protein